uniref:Selenoprotein W n=1 Tax=Sinocyclocheilus rhinocerous TaxID=307959 RepID=A0A673MRV2_9TELE
MSFVYDVVILKSKHVLLNVHVQKLYILFSYTYLSNFFIISHTQTGEGTPSTTGWFEVEVNKKLVHSKKNGDGFVDSESKFKAVVTAIEQAMGK